MAWPEVLVAGYAGVDLVWTAASPPGPHRTALLTGPVEPRPRFGGCAPIVAMLLARQGHRVGLVSWLGDDACGRAYRAKLEAAGVDTQATVFAPGQATPRSLLIYDPDGGVTCCYHPSGSADQKLDARGQAQLAHARMLALTVGPCALTAALLAQRPAGSRVAWGVKADANAYPVGLRRQLLEEADVITMNRDELAFVAEALPGGMSASDDDARLACMRRATSAAMAVTAGRAGVRVAWPDGDVQLPASPIEAENPTGAGDAFFAGFLGALLRDLDPVESARAGMAEAVGFLRTNGAIHSL
jgi:sugar/nucleoside kinase (ribokinase family)